MRRCDTNVTLHYYNLTAVARSVGVRVVTDVQFGFGHRAVLVKIHDAVGALDTTATRVNVNLNIWSDTCYKLRTQAVTVITSALQFSASRLAPTNGKDESSSIVIAEA